MDKLTHVHQYWDKLDKGGSKDDFAEECGGNDLGHYIGYEDAEARACVIVTRRNGNGPGIDKDLFANITSPDRQPGNRLWPSDWMDIKPSGVTKEQPVTGIVLSSDIWNAGNLLLNRTLPGMLIESILQSSNEKESSIIKVTELYQPKELPLAPQRLVAERYKSGGIFDIDNIKSDIALTMSLATTHMQRRIQDKSSNQNLIVVYGGKLITNKEVLKNILDAIHNHRRFHVSNDSMGKSDPWEGTHKSCVACFATTSHHANDSEVFFLGRWASEGGALDFSIDIDQICLTAECSKGIYLPGKSFRNAYYNIFRAIVLEEELDVNLEPLGIAKEDDPKVGTRKDFWIRYWKGSDEWDRERKSYLNNVDNRPDYIDQQKAFLAQGSFAQTRLLKEGRKTDFSVEICLVAYAEVVAIKDGVYQDVFSVLDDIKGGKIRVVSDFFLSNPDGSERPPPDPKKGEWKHVVAKFKVGPGAKWQDSWGNEGQDWPLPTATEVYKSRKSDVHMHGWAG